MDESTTNNLLARLGQQIGNTTIERDHARAQVDGLTAQLAASKGEKAEWESRALGLEAERAQLVERLRAFESPDETPHPTPLGRRNPQEPS